MIIGISVFWLKVVSAFFLFKFLVEKFILQSKRYFLFLILFIVGAILIGIAANILGMMSEGSLNKNSFFPLSAVIITAFQTVGPDLTLSLGIIFSKKCYDKQHEYKNLEIEKQD